ncbi:MAG: YeaH/YhbH family protein [Immundisolibacter sp.]|uniref:YeaH/YhbH family protein n=1 Tax=Immundisolibacter sp. TaxID=1934948 RepID=UPI003D0EACE7
MLHSQFRAFSGESLRSDRSASDRARHRHKVRQAIRENIGDIVAEEAIIGRSGDRMVKVPIRGIREYRFVYGKNQPGVGTGEGDTEVGQSVGQGEQSGAGKGQGGNEAGQDYYETEISLEELIDIMFEDLHLPDLERKKLRLLPSQHALQRKGFRRAGIRVHLDKKRTALQRIRRQIAQGQVEHPEQEDAPALDTAQRFPFRKEDMIYRRLMPDTRPQSNAVVICMMDTSGSMDTTKKYLARSFFFLLYQFVRSRYAEVEIVFIAHHAAASEVTEDEFFHKGESGGTVISSAYQKCLEVINERYHPSLWNIYAFHCSDGDNFPGDNDKTVQAAEAICEVANLFGYGEIKPPGRGIFESSMLETFGRIKADGFHALTIHGKDDIWPGLKAFLQKDRAAHAAEAEHA